ncbi:MAG: hypothetical protein IKN43_10865 [Selenomonadaceae bacterium]|nr:hypothetical protein [Selenomonadaceae bacterium]
MNFIWDIALQAQRDELSLDELFFQPAKNPSPCYEQSFKSINEAHVYSPLVEINPFMRFTGIFQYLLHRDVVYDLEAENKQFIFFAFDAIVHILTEIDLCHGMTTREFYVRRVKKELLYGVYGDLAQEAMESMTKEEQLKVADELYCITETGGSFASFCKIVKEIFPGVFIYQGRQKRRRIYVYLDRKETPTLVTQWDFLRDTFLPIDMEVRVFWDTHFGIIGVEPTMLTDGIAIF